MLNHKSNLWTFLWVGLAAVILMGCGAKGQPAEFKQTAGEMKEGPGVLTGEEGALVVYDSERGGAFPQFKRDKSEEASDTAEKNAKTDAEKAPEASQTQVAAGKTTKDVQVTPEAAREFQEFQEWKKEQKSFKEFQEWKKSAEGQAEYQEFLEWKEWKSYQEWKKQQEQ